MSKMFIRVKKDGTIYAYNEYLARNPACEVVPEEIAYPERFVDKAQVAKTKKAQVKRKSKLDLSTEDVPDDAPTQAPGLGEDASRGLPE